ncbi:LysM peptidoglycan-binding domain-containing protein [Paludisphaera soli]|uniref:LysM peptidoglycan-binding domain-containing protein n=1 Tax=Paludisphaera soli TaxID=2712865 RepID=UPI0013EA0849|nr:LysM peptidoglycan-binding domain-containing protein [Paludisphaera soli]
MVEPGSYPDPDEPQALTPDAVDHAPAYLDDQAQAYAYAEPDAPAGATTGYADHDEAADGSALEAEAKAARSPAAMAKVLHGAVAVAGACGKAASFAAGRVAGLAWAYPRASAASALSVLVLAGVLSLKSGKSPTVQLPGPKPSPAASNTDRPGDEPRLPEKVAAETSQEAEPPAPASEAVAEAPAPAPATDEVERTSALGELGFPALPAMDEPSPGEPPAPDLDEPALPAPAGASMLLARADLDPKGDLPAPALEPDAEEPKAAPAPAPLDEPKEPSFGPAPLPAPAADQGTAPSPAADVKQPAPAPAAHPAPTDLGAAPEPTKPATEPPAASAPAETPKAPGALDLPAVADAAPEAPAADSAAPAAIGLPQSAPAPPADAAPVPVPVPLPLPLPSNPTTGTTPPTDVPPLGRVPESDPTTLRGGGDPLPNADPAPDRGRTAEPPDGDWVPIKHSAGEPKLDPGDLDLTDADFEARPGRDADPLGERRDLEAEEPLRFVSEGSASAAPVPTAAAPPAVDPASARRDEGRMETVLHKVQPGENFWTISRTHYASGRYYRALGKANADQFQRLEDLYVGAVVRIPPPEDLDPAFIDPPGGRSARNRDPAEPETAPTRTAQADAAPAVRRSGRNDGELNLPVSDPSTERVADRDDRDRRRISPREDLDEPTTVTRRAESRPVHKIRARETLRSIARDRLGDSRRAREILDLNRDVVDDPAHLVVGQILNLPDDAE